MARKFHKGQVVDVYSAFSKDFMGPAVISDWIYDRQDKTYSYILKTLHGKPCGIMDECQLSAAPDKSRFGDKFRTVELKCKERLVCPMCDSANTIIVEALHGKPDTPRWFYHDCNECCFANALSDGFIVEDADGELTVPSLEG